MKALGLASLAAAMAWVIYHPADSTSVEQGGALGWCLAVLLITAGCQVIDALTQQSYLPKKHPKLDMTIQALTIALAGWMGLAAMARTGWLGSPPDLGGDWRMASNEAWVWVAGAAWFLVARRWLADRGAATSMMGLLVVASVLVSVHAVHQSFVSLPETLRQYEADPDFVLSQIGLDAPAGSDARMIFENRLRDGGPTASFALANTLAGVLAIGAVLVAGMLLAGWSRWLWWMRLGWIATFGLLFMALWQTDSRAGVGAVVVTATSQLLSFAWERWGGRSILARPIGWIPMGVVMGLLTLPFVGVWLGGPRLADSLPQTIQFRLQYWASSWNMANLSWFGGGPGNFQMIYHTVRNPDAHEIIADPHHFWFETLAAGGYPAASLLAALIGVAIVRICRRDEEVAPEQESVGVVSVWQRGSIAAGASLGVWWVWSSGLRGGEIPDFDANLLALPAAALMAVLWWLSTTTRSDSTVPVENDAIRKIAAMACGAALIHLSLSGGWTVPGMAVFVWTLAAIATSSDALRSNAGMPAQAMGQRRRVWQWSRPLITFGLAAVCFGLSYQPVRTAEREIKAAQTSLRKGNLTAGNRQLMAAMEADKWAFDPAFLLLQSIHRQTLAGAARGLDSTSETFLEAVRDCRERAGHDPTKWRVLGDLMLHRYQVDGKLETLHLAERALSAAERYSPWHQGIVAQHAVILSELQRLGDSNAAINLPEKARMAISLSRRGNIVTRELSLQSVIVAKPVGALALRGPVRQSAQEAMDELLATEATGD